VRWDGRAVGFGRGDVGELGGDFDDGWLESW